MKRTVSRLLAAGVLVGAAAHPASDASAENVASFTSATLEMEFPPGGTPVPLDLDPEAPPDDAAIFSIPPGGVARIRVTGVTAAAGAAAIHLMDQDAAWDDELDLRGTPVPLAAGAPFELIVYLLCGTPSAEVGSSGEQSAEIYIRDGSNRIPKSGMQGGFERLSWWRIDCDKQTSQTLGVAGGTVNAFWGDSLSLPPGALASDVNVGMANMYPLLHTDAVPPGSLEISEAQSLSPDGLALGAPATLTFRYTHEEVGELADENTLRVYKYEPLTQQWGPIPGETIDPVNDTISVPIGVFGTYGFAAAGPPAVPAFSGRGGALSAALLLLFAGAAVSVRRWRRLSSATPR